MQTQARAKEHFTDNCKLILFAHNNNNNNNKSLSNSSNSIIRNYFLNVWKSTWKFICVIILREENCPYSFINIKSLKHLFLKSIEKCESFFKKKKNSYYYTLVIRFLSTKEKEECGRLELLHKGNKRERETGASSLLQLTTTKPKLRKHSSQM